MLILKIPFNEGVAVTKKPKRVFVRVASGFEVKKFFLIACIFLERISNPEERFVIEFRWFLVNRYKCLLCASEPHGDVKVKGRVSAWRSSVEEGSRCRRGLAREVRELQEALRALLRRTSWKLPGGGEAGLRQIRIRMDGARGGKEAGPY